MTDELAKRPPQGRVIESIEGTRAVTITEWGPQMAETYERAVELQFVRPAAIARSTVLALPAVVGLAVMSVGLVAHHFEIEASVAIAMIIAVGGVGAAAVPGVLRHFASRGEIKNG